MAKYLSLSDVVALLRKRENIIVTDGEVFIDGMPHNPNTLTTMARNVE